MEDMRNQDRENDRTGPKSIFRPLPDPKNQKNDPGIKKKVPKLARTGPGFGMTLGAWLGFASASCFAFASSLFEPGLALGLGGFAGFLPKAKYKT